MITCVEPGCFRTTAKCTMSDNPDELELPHGITFPGKEWRPTTKVIIPVGDTVPIPASAFSSKFYMNAIEIPSGVTHIGTEAFRCCSGLKRLQIPAGVVWLSSRFLSQTNLNVLVLAGTVRWSFDAIDWYTVKTVVFLGDALPEELFSCVKYNVTLCASAKCVAAIFQKRDETLKEAAEAEAEEAEMEGIQLPQTPTVEQIDGYIRATLVTLPPARIRLYESGLYHRSLHHELDGITRAWFKRVELLLLRILPRVVTEMVLESLPLNAPILRAE